MDDVAVLESPNFRIRLRLERRAAHLDALAVASGVRLAPASPRARLRFTLAAIAARVRRARDLDRWDEPPRLDQSRAHCEALRAE